MIVFTDLERPRNILDPYWFLVSHEMGTSDEEEDDNEDEEDFDNF